MKSNDRIHVGMETPDRYYLIGDALDDFFVHELTRIGRFSWNRRLRYWTFPAAGNYLGVLKRKFGEEIVFDPSFELGELCRETVIRQMSRHTLDAYFYFNRELLRHAKKYAYQITEDDIDRFLEMLVSAKKSAPATVNLAIDAIKFFLCGMRGMKLYLSPRPRKGVRLPGVMSMQEIMRLFDSVENIKHRTLLMVAYSAGLRVSEAASLRIPDIDFDRKVIRVSQGKGRKDRYTLLSQKAETAIREYLAIYRPARWLFEGQGGESHLSVRTIQHIFEDALRRAKINKPLSFHSLRHSFATHLLENGIDIRYIQELLGHCSIKTTEIYTHVQKKKMENIKSPLDMM